jgi:hypothetical protein
MSTFDLLKYWPVILVASGVIASASADNWRLGEHTEELEELSIGVEHNEDAIEEIQRLLIRRQGEVELLVQRIEAEQRNQGGDLAQIIRILESIQGGPRP